MLLKDMPDAIVMLMRGRERAIACMAKAACATVLLQSRHRQRERMPDHAFTRGRARVSRKKASN
jgi:hypothetical protein